MSQQPSEQADDKLEAARALVADLEARGKADIGYPFTDEVLDALQELEAQDKPELMRTLDALKRAGVTHMVKAMRDHRKKREAEAKPNIVEVELDDGAARDALLQEVEPAAQAMLRDPALLFQIGNKIEALGVVNERHNALLLYLAVLSQITNDPASAAVKGDSSSGKSFMVEQGLKLFPEHAHIDLTSVSERGLIYDARSYAHKTVVFFEAQGQANEFTNYVIRTLISEKRIKHQTVVQTPTGPVGKEIVKQGPTGFVTTTTSPELHAETRLASSP